MPAVWEEDDATEAAFALFERGAPGSRPEQIEIRRNSPWTCGTYGRPDADRAWAGERGGGILVSVLSFGPTPSDGLDRLFHVAWPDRGLAVFDVALDYTQTEIGLEVLAVSELDLDRIITMAREVFRQRGAVDASVAPCSPRERRRR
jgi:hypothetical protein